jgi:soluble lytic murein transglycosylase
MKRLAVVALIILTVAVGVYFSNQYWVHRYDGLIARQAAVYRLDSDLVWSMIYEETYFRPWMVGKDGEIGLMQITPAVGREWAAETGLPDLQKQMAQNPEPLLRDPERNIQVGSWYLEKIREQYRDTPDADARMIAGYNAGPSRAAEWNKVAEGQKPLTRDEFVTKIDIASTRAYVSSILDRYDKLKGRTQRAANSPAATSPEQKPSR